MTERSEAEGVAQKCVVTLRAAWAWTREGPPPCGKPAKGSLADGTPACGVHLAAEKRSQAAEEKRRAAADDGARRRALAEARCQLLNAVAPDLEAVPYRPTYGPLSDFGGNPEFVVVSFDAVARLAGDQ